MKMVVVLVKTQPTQNNMLVSSSALGFLVLSQVTVVEIHLRVQSHVEIIRFIIEIALSILVDGQGLFF